MLRHPAPPPSYLDVDQGSEVMQNIMTNLENGGSISEESQGLEGARDMFEVSERLSEVV